MPTESTTWSVAPPGGRVQKEAASAASRQITHPPRHLKELTCWLPGRALLHLPRAATRTLRHAGPSLIASFDWLGAMWMWCTLSQQL